MGFWRNNPADPCCNPPAGNCQCTPCRWRIIGHSGGDPSANVFETLGLPISISAVSRFSRRATNESLRRSGIISRIGPPWRRIWSRAIEHTPAEAAAIGTTHSDWNFGYYQIGYHVGGAAGFDVSWTDWFLGLDLQDDPNSGTLLTRSMVFHFVWRFQPGSNVAGGPPYWNCWGPNKLYLEKTSEGFGSDGFVEFDPANPHDNWVIVEPDV